jgi:cell fate regulator YaaT (PSP1 superfamily)
MGCSGCSSGRGCSTAAPGLPGGCRNNGSCGTGGCNKLGVFDWLAGMELPHGQKQFDIVEVRFKNSRKEFFRNTDGIELNVGDVIAVESSPGHDMGVVSLTGELVKMQMKKKGIAFDSQEIKKVYRKAKQSDIQKWQEAQNLEFETMHKARKIAVGLGLQMKLSDVEFQGDKTKATFYYTADDRVDFRELIKLLASEFKVRIEMRQIGARQEASRLGGIGSCGRELCCSTWLTDFRTVNTSAARYQQLALNPLKLAGQCGKLKCCLNYELDSYLDAIKDIPMNDVKLETERGRAFHQKTDIFKRIMWYSYTDAPETFIPLTIEKVKEIMEMNTQGKKPADLQVHQIMQHQKEILPDYENVVGQDSISRFDNRKRNNKNRKPNQQGGQGGGNQNQKRRRPQGGNNNPNKKKGDAK